MLWSPLPHSWDSGAAISAASAKPLDIPDHVLPYRTLLHTDHNQPFSLVLESCTANVLSAPAH